MADMAHISGLVAAGLIPSPFEYADIVTTTTHKSLRGPRGALIFYRKGIRSVNAKGVEVMYDIGPKIDSAVFPGLQGGPHNHTIAGIAVALKQCLSQEFVDYSKQVIKNSKALANRLMELGYDLVTGGTDNHLCLVDLRPKNLEGARIETILDMAHIACNKNTCPGDQSAFRPGGIRLGTPALTSRGFNEEDFIVVANLIDEAIKVYIKYQSVAGKTMKDFKEFISTNEDFKNDITNVANKVENFTEKFDIPGNDEC